MDEVLRERLNKEALARASKINYNPVRRLDHAGRLTTGNIALDVVTGGGLGIGRYSIYWGKPNGGKTTAALQAAKQCIDEGGIVAYFDIEGTLNIERVEAMGINMEYFHVYRLDFENFFTGEDLMELAEEFMIGKVTKDSIAATKKKPSKHECPYTLFIWDSIGATPTAAAIEGSVRDANMGKTAQMWSKFVTKLIVMLPRAGATMLFTNHINPSFDQYKSLHGGDNMPGGERLVYHSSQIIKFSAKRKTGHILFRALVIRNKLADTENEETTLKFDLSGKKAEYDVTQDLTNVVQQLGVFTKADGTPSFDGNSKWFEGAEIVKKSDEIYKTLLLDDDLYRRVYVAVRQKLSENPVLHRQNDGIIEDDDENTEE